MRELTQLEKDKIEILATRLADRFREKATAVLLELSRPLEEDEVIHTDGSRLQIGVTRRELLSEDFNLYDWSNSVWAEVRSYKTKKPKSPRGDKETPR